MNGPLQANHLRLETLLREELEGAGSVLGADRTNPSKWDIYEKAVKRFNDFVLDGKVPSDLTCETATRTAGA